MPSGARPRFHVGRVPDIIDDVENAFYPVSHRKEARPSGSIDVDGR
jgi:hypothetical protein